MFDNGGVRLRGKLLRPFRYPVRWLAFLAGGVPAVLVFPGPSLSYLAWFALVPAMALFTRAGTTREAIARGWWFGAGYLIAILQWMTPEIGPGVVLIGGIFGCMYSPFAVAVRRLLRPAVTWPRLLAALAVVPATWLIPEWIRSYQGLGGPVGPVRRVAVAAPRRARAGRRRRRLAGQRGAAAREHRPDADTRRIPAGPARPGDGDGDAGARPRLAAVSRSPPPAPPPSPPRPPPARSPSP